jgi:hypothetical protein
MGYGRSSRRRSYFLILKRGGVMSDGREEREEREKREELESWEEREDRVDRDRRNRVDEREPERVDS